MGSRTHLSNIREVKWASEYMGLSKVKRHASWIDCVSVELDFSVWSRKISSWLSTPRRLFYRHVIYITSYRIS